MRISTAKPTLETLIKNKLPVLLKGSPGIGKTDLVKSVAESLGYDLIIAHPVVDEPVDYKGLPFIVDGEAEFLPYGMLKRLINADNPTIFFLDDLGQALPMVQAACMNLLLNRAINEQRISDHVTFVAATNRREDKAGVQGILEPVKSRFAAIIEINPHPDDWIDWAIEHGMPSEIIGFIKFRPALLNDFKPTADITNSPSPRTVAFAGRIYEAIMDSESFNTPDQKAVALKEAIAGACGEAFAVEFLSWLKVYNSLPTMEQILADPHGVQIPSAGDQLSALYAFTLMVAENTPIKGDGAFTVILDRLPKEFQIMAVSFASKRNKELFNSSAVRNWIVRNHEAILEIGHIVKEE